MRKGVKSNEKKIIVNKTVKRALRELGVEVENENEELLNLIPDSIVKERTRMTIFDIACSYDFYISETYSLKLEKYKSLNAFIERDVMPCICDAVIIGSLGTVHKAALKVMIDIGMPKAKAKGLEKWFSTSNIISSRQIWNVRCKRVKEH